MTAIDDVLERYPRAISHLWRQSQDGQLGFVFGAGVSKPFKVPDWAHLVSRVADAEEVRSGSSYNETSALPLPILTEVLFQRFATSERPRLEALTHNLRDTDRLVLAKWRRVIHKALYAGVPETIEELGDVDSPYSHLLTAVRRAALTVTYNFDDILERLLLASRTDHEKRSTQTFQTIVDARVPFRNGHSVILHPNGYLPRNLLESADDTLVFSEGSFADQLIDVMAGQSSTILHYLTKSTFLLIGLSLADETLRHLLRQSARLSPGSYHYYVRWVSDDEGLDAEAIAAEVQTNFEVYNLITLHLTSTELHALGDLIEMTRDEIVGLAEDRGVPLHFTYYLAGVPGVGKTTTFSYFNSLVTHDEWTEPRLPLMSIPFTDLSPAEADEIDQWVMKQIGLKNQRMIQDFRTQGVGIHLVDRCPPDAITFTQRPDWPEKARSVLEAISPGRSHRKIHDGHVLLLQAEPSEVAVRAALREKQASASYTSARMADLRDVYGGTGTTVLEVNGMSPTAVARAVAKVVFFEPFVTADLQGRVERIRDGSGNES